MREASVGTEGQIGRGGLVIPAFEVEHDDLSWDVFNFFDKLWKANGFITESSEFQHELIVPSSVNKPAVVIRGKAEAQTERHALLLSPQKVGSFFSHLSVVLDTDIPPTQWPLPSVVYRGKFLSAFDFDPSKDEAKTMSEAVFVSSRMSHYNSAIEKIMAETVELLS